MSSILVTGFTPFKGRQANASWIAARSLPDRHRGMPVAKLELPVVWGSPGKLLEEMCERSTPGIILALGEGRKGWFDIETLARNQRGKRKDNTGSLPPQPLSCPGGPAERSATADCAGIHRQLRAAGYPIRISTNAGGFLCEETLYALETLNCRFDGLVTTLFVHLPPYGTPLEFEGVERTCDEELLAPFTLRLLDLAVDAQEILASFDADH